MNTMDHERQQFLNRIRELEDISWNESRYMFTGFLNEAEYSDVLLPGPPSCGMTAFGGFEGAVRVMVRFGDPDTLGYEEPFPITVLHISPLMEKYADSLTHRDYLGAILNLGIERRVVGDILVGSASAYVMCESRIAGYIAQNLLRVRHTSVSVQLSEEIPEDVRPKQKPLDIQVSSNRADAVAAQVFRLPRSSARSLIESGQVYINGRLLKHASLQLAENDNISVRHMGKFRYEGQLRYTRKGRLCVRVWLYV